jgi:hypothetical protein
MEIGVRPKQTLFIVLIVRFLASCLLIVVSSMLIHEWFYCGLMASKWVGLNWTPEMIATDRRGKLVGNLAFAMQLLLPWVLPNGRQSSREKAREPVLFANIPRPERISAFWSRYLLRLALSISCTMLLSALLFVSMHETALYVTTQKRLETLLHKLISLWA